jgi:predicted nucleic acid-binding protein
LNIKKEKEKRIERLLSVVDMEEIEKKIELGKLDQEIEERNPELITAINKIGSWNI